MKPDWQAPSIAPRADAAQKAVLVLEDCTVFQGRGFGACHQALDQSAAVRHPHVTHARSAPCPEGLSDAAEGRSPPQQVRRTESGWAGLVFAAKTTASALIALLVAFTFNFDQPQWALLIVFIVAQPQSGLVLAKSFYRIIGIFIGAGVALLFVALFAQERVPFLGALALWIGLCCFGFQYARNFTAYTSSFPVTPP